MTRLWWNRKNEQFPDTLAGKKRKAAVFAKSAAEAREIREEIEEELGISERILEKAFEVWCGEWNNSKTELEFRSWFDQNWDRINSGFYVSPR